MTREVSHAIGLGPQQFRQRHLKRPFFHSLDLFPEFFFHKINLVQNMQSAVCINVLAFCEEVKKISQVCSNFHSFLTSPLQLNCLKSTDFYFLPPKYSQWPKLENRRLFMKYRQSGFHPQSDSGENLPRLLRILNSALPHINDSVSQLFMGIQKLENHFILISYKSLIKLRGIL